MSKPIKCGDCKNELHGKAEYYPSCEIGPDTKARLCVSCAEDRLAGHQDLNCKIGEVISEFLDEDEVTGDLLDDAKKAFENATQDGGVTEDFSQVLAILHGEKAKIDSGAVVDPDDIIDTLLNILEPVEGSEEADKVE